MKRLQILLVLSLLALQAARAGVPETASAGAATGAAQELIQVEHDWGDALLRQDVDRFSRCVADEWVLTTSNGTLVTKAMAQADLRSGALRIESFRLDDVRVRVYGSAAVVSGLITEKSRLDDKDTSGRRRFTDVFVERDGRWQAVASHESAVPAGR